MNAPDRFDLCAPAAAPGAGARMASKTTITKKG